MPAPWVFLTTSDLQTLFGFLAILIMVIGGGSLVHSTRDGYLRHGTQTNLSFGLMLLSLIILAVGLFLA